MQDHRDKSFWLDSYGPYSPNPPLTEDLAVDVAIIGAGFTGLCTAYNLRRESPGLKVAVLEGEIVGYGASGRNGGFSMTLFGMEPTITKLLFGRARTVEAHRYMERAVDYVRDLVAEHDLQSDYWHPGFLRVATRPAYVRRIQRDLDILAGMGIGGIEWWDRERVRAEVESPVFLGAWWEPRCGLLHPAKHVRELKRITETAGARIFERTPVTAVERGSRFVLRTPGGSVTAEKIVFATNAYSHHFAELRARQTPVFTHMVITEPLSDQQRAAIGWRNRQGIEDARNLVHYFRLTADGRLAMGGSDVTVPYGRNLDLDRNPRVFAGLERDMIAMFPALRGIRFTHRWGGPVSITMQLVPEIGFLGDRRAVYSLGCIGHGVSLTHLNGRTIADLLLDRRTDLTDVWFVGRRSLPWPPEPLRFVAGHAVRAALRLQDAWNERGAGESDSTAESRS